MKEKQAMTNSLYPPSIPEDTELNRRIIQHESKERYAYQDSLGYTSIGIGRNIDKRSGKGLRDDEIMYLFANDLTECKNHLETFSWFNKLDMVRRGVMLEMRFNLGPDRFLGFKKMIAAIQVNDYRIAVKEMCDSKWATQIGKGRLNDLCNRMTTGKYS